MTEAKSGRTRTRLSLILTLSLVAALMSAEFSIDALAHHPVVEGDVDCAQGQQLVTWTVSNSETTGGTNRTMTVDLLTLTLDGNPLTPVTDYLNGIGVGSVFPPKSLPGSQQTAISALDGNLTGALVLTVRADWDGGGSQNVSRTASVTLSGDCGPPPSASVTTACDPFGPEQGNINVSVVDADGPVSVTIDGDAGQVGDNAVDAGDHLVVVTVGQLEVLSETVTVAACSSPSASVSSDCDPFGAALGAIDISVSGLAQTDTALATIDGNPASFGSNAAAAGLHDVVVTVNGESVLSQQVTVQSCSEPQASVSTDCDPFGDALGSINISVGDLAPGDSASATIDGNPASFGSNPAASGDHLVVVSVNGQMLISDEVTVGSCSTPTAAAEPVCDPFGDVLGRINVSVTGLSQGDVASVLIDDQAASLGNNPAAAGDHHVEVLVNGTHVLDSLVNVATCSNPEAAAVTTCDPFGAALGSIDVDVIGTALNDVVAVLIDQQAASVGSNPAEAGSHQVTVLVNGATLLDETLDVESCSSPAAAALTSCDPGDDESGTIDLSVSGLEDGDTAGALIDGKAASIGSNAAETGTHSIDIVVNGASVLSGDVDVEACPVEVLGEEIDRPTAVLPATGLAAGGLALWAALMLLLGAMSWRRGSPRVAKTDVNEAKIPVTAVKTSRFPTMLLVTALLASLLLMKRRR